MAHILLIDDDDALRTMLRLTLIHFGHTVIEARNGREGLEVFPHMRADLVITDIVMPDVEGIEVLITLRQRQPPVKIIAISGGGRVSATDYLNIAQQLGAARVLTKPFSNEALKQAIDEVLAEDGATAAAEAP